MAPVIAYTLPAMQLVCNLVMSDAPVWNDTSIAPVWNDTSTGPTVNQTTPEIPTATIPAGYIAFPDLGVAYKVYTGTTVAFPWKQARQKCLDQGARLAVLDTFVKFETVMSLSPTTRVIHVGINSMYDNKEWVSNTDGSTIANVPWAPGNPVSSTASCVAASRSPRGLRNIACTTGGDYACEVPISNKNTTQKSMLAKISVN